MKPIPPGAATDTITWFLYTTMIAQNKIVRSDYNYSIAYFCDKCGEVWGRGIISGRKYSVIHRGCRNCGSQWEGDDAGCFTRRDPWCYFDSCPTIETAPRALLINDFINLEKHHGKT